MKRLFDLTKGEQRIVILIVAALVATAFVKHWFQSKSRPVVIESVSTPSPSPTIRPQAEDREPKDSR